VNGVAEREVPTAIEAEAQFIGSAIVDRRAVDELAGIVLPEDCYSHPHQLVWREILRLHRESKPTDRVSVATALRDVGKLEAVGGIEYLRQLEYDAATAASAPYFAGLVVEKSRLRALIDAGHRIARAGLDGESDVDAAISEAESALRAAIDRRGSAQLGRTMRQALERNAQIVADARRGDGPLAMMTPWSDLNAMIGGFWPGQLAIWAGSPKAGKSALVTCLSDYIASKYGTVVYFALEMGEQPMVRRYLAMRSGVSARKQQRVEYAEDSDEADRIAEARAWLELEPIVFVERRGISLAEIRREMQRLAASEWPPVAMVVDHVGFLRDVDAKAGERTSKHERMDFVYRELLRIAQDYDVVVHAVQHVNREGMKGKPSLADIRDGGNPEGHAHAVIFAYREFPTGDAEQRKAASLIVAATREGDAGEIEHMQFTGHRGLWTGADDYGRAWFEA